MVASFVVLVNTGSVVVVEGASGMVDGEVVDVVVVVVVTSASGTIICSVVDVVAVVVVTSSVTPSVVTTASSSKFKAVVAVVVEEVVAADVVLALGYRCRNLYLASYKSSQHIHIHLYL